MTLGRFHTWLYHRCPKVYAAYIVVPKVHAWSVEAQDAVLLDMFGMGLGHWANLENIYRGYHSLN